MEGPELALELSLASTAGEALTFLLRQARYFHFEEQGSGPRLALTWRVIISYGNRIMLKSKEDNKRRQKGALNEGCRRDDGKTEVLRACLSDIALYRPRTSAFPQVLHVTARGIPVQELHCLALFSILKF